MARRKMLCQLYQAGQSCFDNGLTAGRYLAAVSGKPEKLPRAMRRDDHIVQHGYGVGFGPHGQWYFFDDIAPAHAFGRAARMSLDCNAWGIYPAAHELLNCQIHNADERVLHLDLTGEMNRYADEEVEHLKRFVQGVKENPWSSNWHPPTGYITAYKNGVPAKTRERSLPL